MGASQSSGAGAAPGGGGAPEPVKTSYYELLDVERTATDDEIKKAYRRKALELHPDRNYGDVERATALFADVQTAYQVLSDPQERSWYDAHEGDILRGGTGEGGGEDHYEGNMKVTTADDIARMLGKFRANVEFSDAPSGFYGFLRETFEQLAQEEEHAANRENVDVPDYPSFGHKDDVYDDVVRDFYNSWNGFATRKTFAWKDKYRVSEAPDRRVRRLIEKENKRFREEGIREFNDAVRTLVQFVRKRDPRYTPNTQTTDERAQAQRKQAQAQAARARAAHAAKMEEAVPEWATRRDPEEEEEETEEESEEEHYECVACHKTFKSERQWEAHEKSKKHQKAIFALKKKMRKENAHLNLDDEVKDNGTITPVEADGFASDEAASASDMDDVTDVIKNATLEDDISASEDDETNNTTATHPPPKDAIPTPTASSEEEDSSTTDDEYATRSDIESRLASYAKTSPSPPPTTASSPPSQPEPPTKEKDTPKLGKAAQKRAKRAAKQADSSVAVAGTSEDPDVQHRCVVCNAGFPSKTQLFAHIKGVGHAAPISVTKGVGSGGGGGGSGGGKKKGKRK